MSTIEQKYQKVKQRIADACLKSQRSSSDVQLLAVSKTKPAEAVRACYQLGQRHFGENYLQDAESKVEALCDLADIQWHFIGPLQSNKTRSVAEHFDWLETLSRKKIAQRLNDQRPDGLPPLKVLLQVNISGEAQKSGLAPAEVLAFAEQLRQLPRLQLKGLMCIPEATEDGQRLAHQFDQMKLLFEQIVQHHPQVDCLSMGMSADLELAIAAGSTQVRIGTDIFGARS